MKRIFTSSLLLVCLLAFNQSLQAQTCSVSMTPPAQPLRTVPVNPAQDFSTHSQTTLGTFTNGQLTDLISPVFSFGTDQTSVTFGYELSVPAGANPANVWNYVIELYYANGFLNFNCVGNVPANSFALPQDVTSTPTFYYFTISGITLPANTQFLVRLKLDVPGFMAPITAERFSIPTITRPAPAGTVLPVLFSRFDAKSVNAGVALTWNVEAELNVKSYEIERSNDGRNFTHIGSVLANGQSAYSFTDNKPVATGFYRIKVVDVDGKYMYSTIVSLRGGRTIVALRAYPMPVQNTFTIQHSTANSNSVIQISGADGRLIQSIIPSAGSQQTKVDLSTANAGLYLIRFDNGNGEIQTLKVMKQ